MQPWEVALLSSPLPSLLWTDLEMREEPGGTNPKYKGGCRPGKRGGCWLFCPVHLLQVSGEVEEKEKDLAVSTW